MRAREVASNPLPSPGALLKGPLFACALFSCALLCAPGARAGQDGRPLIEQAQEELAAWDIEGAARLLDRLSAQRPDAPETQWLRGRVLFEQGRYDEAGKAFEAAEAAADGVHFTLDRKLARAAAEEVRGAAVSESAHFVLRTKAGKDALLAPYALAALERAYASLTRDLGFEPKDKVRVEVYDSPQALARVSPLTVAEIKASGTIALCKYNRLMITSPRALLRGYPWLDTVSHEFVHYLVTKKGRGTVPIWLQEGLAKFLETRWRGEPGLAVDAASLSLLLKAAKGNALIPFAAMHPSIAKLPTQEKAALAFAEVEAAVRLLYLRGGQGALTELVAGLARGLSDEQAVARAYGKSFVQFEEDWRAEVAKPREKRLAQSGADRSAHPMAPKKLVFREDVKRKEDPPGGPSPDVAAEPLDPEARRAVRLGELMLARRRFGAAAVEYGRARRLLGGDEVPVVARRYAFAQLQNGKLAEAEEALQAATRKDPGDEAAQVLLAKVLIARNQAGGAGAALEAAVAEDPFDPELHAAWIALARMIQDKSLEARERRALALCNGMKAPGGETAPAEGAKVYTPEGNSTGDEGHP
jgi:tetratricopeptide (TPR) repeat protein